MSGFAAMLLATMAMSVMAFFVLAVVASELIDEFGLSKLQLGLLGAANTGVGGLFAPAAGRLADRFGARRSMAAVLFISGTTSTIVALAHSFTLLLIAMSISGLAQGWANPATNKAILGGVEPERRGLITGIKQSGVQLAVFSAGFAMPVITASMGWRAGLWIAAALSFSTMLGLALITEIGGESTGAPEEERPERPASSSSRLSPFVYRVAVYGFLLGLVGGGLSRFLPLFAEEAAGFSTEQAGRVFGIQGLVAIPTRIVSGMLLDRGVAAKRILVVMGVGASIAIMLVLAAADGPGAFLWVGTILSGLTLGSWQTAANLSMIRQPRDPGRASGVLMSGFLLGLTLGAPVVGWSIDSFDSYYPAWIGGAVAAMLGALVVMRAGEGGDRGDRYA